MYISGQQTTITNAGGTFTVGIDDAVDTYYFQGTATLAAGYAITPSGVPTKQTIIKIFYNGNVTTTAANQVVVFGTALSFEQALKGKCFIVCTYDFTASAWVVTITEGFEPSAYDGVTNTTLTLVGQTVTLTYSQSKNYQRIVGSGVLAGDFTLTSSGSFPDDYKIFVDWDATVTKGASTISLMGQILNSEQALAGSCMVIATYDLGATTWRLQLISNPNVHYDVFIVPVSFETALQCDNSFIAPCDGTFTQMDSFVTKALAGTDDGTITLKINGVAVTNGQITIALSSALNTQDSATPTALNLFSKGDTISVTGAKTTAGGSALTSIQYTTSS